MKQWTTLAEKIGGIDLGETQLLDAQLDIQAVDTRFLTSDNAYPFNHNEAGNSNPDSLLISPLPQFTSILPGTFSDLRPLPDVGSDPESLHGQSPTCASPDHPVTCPCVEVPPFPEMPPSANSSRSRSASFIERPPDSSSERNNDLSSLPATPASSGDRDILRHRIPRVSSHSRPSSRAPSEFASRTPSPPRPGSSMQAHSRIPSPSEHSFSPSVVPSAPGISRLHELMERPMVSSSLPNMSNHFPSSLTRDSHLSHEIHSSRSPSRSRSASLHALPQPIVQRGRGIHSDVVNSTEAASSVFKPSPFNDAPLYGSPPGPVSSASAAAMVLEKAQREQRARRRAEREQEKQQEREMSEKERETTERGRSRVDIERQVPGHQTAATSSRPPSHREPMKVHSYTTVSSDYFSHRSHSGRPGSSVPRDTYVAHKHTIKAIPILPTTRV
jgi:hypothetical protein